MSSKDRPPFNLIPERESLGFLLADTTRLMRRIYSGYLGEHQLTLAQMRALVYLARNQGLRQVELADLLEIQPITLARMVDQLADIGLVERRADSKDRRAFQLYLTAQAEPLLAFISVRTEAFQRQALAGLAEDEARLLFSGLNKVRDNLAALLG